MSDRRLYTILPLLELQTAAHFFGVSTFRRGDQYCAKAVGHWAFYIINSLSQGRLLAAGSKGIFALSPLLRIFTLVLAACLPAAFRFAPCLTVRCVPCYLPVTVTLSQLPIFPSPCAFGGRAKLFLLLPDTDNLRSFGGSPLRFFAFSC